MNYLTHLKELSLGEMVAVAIAFTAPIIIAYSILS
jgi:hypothetical protein